MVIVFFFSRVNFLQPPLSPSPSIHFFIFWLKDHRHHHFFLSFFLVLEAINSSPSSPSFHLLCREQHHLLLFISSSWRPSPSQHHHFIISIFSSPSVLDAVSSVSACCYRAIAAAIVIVQLGVQVLFLLPLRFAAAVWVSSSRELEPVAAAVAASSYALFCSSLLCCCYSCLCCSCCSRQREAQLFLTQQLLLQLPWASDSGRLLVGFASFVVRHSC